MEYALEKSAKLRIQEADVDDARLARRDAILDAFTPEINAGTYTYSKFGRNEDPETNTFSNTTSLPTDIKFPEELCSSTVLKR